MNQSAAGSGTSAAKPSSPGIIVIVLAALVLFEVVVQFGSAIGLGESESSIISVVAALIILLLHGWNALGWRNLIAYLVIAVSDQLYGRGARGCDRARLWSVPLHRFVWPEASRCPAADPGSLCGDGLREPDDRSSDSANARRPQERWVNSGPGTPRGDDHGCVGCRHGSLPIHRRWNLDWHTGGPYFGVGFHNFLGWFGTVFCYLLVYCFYASRVPEQPNPSLTDSRLFWSMPVFLYAAFGFGNITPVWVGGIQQPYASPNNYNGSPQTLAQSLALVCIYVMGIPVVASLLSLWRREVAT